MIVGKEFDQKLYDDNDPIAKCTLKQLLSDVYGVYEFQENEGEKNKSFNQGFWDIKCSIKKKQYKIEAEIKNKKWWTCNRDDPFMYDTMHLAGRKEKHKLDAYAFSVISSDLNWAFIVKTNNLNKYGYNILKPNIFSNGELELFMSVNIKYGQFYFKKNGSWKRI